MLRPLLVDTVASQARPVASRGIARDDRWLVVVGEDRRSRAPRTQFDVPVAPGGTLVHGRFHARARQVRRFESASALRARWLSTSPCAIRAAGSGPRGSRHRRLRRGGRRRRSRRSSGPVTMREGRSLRSCAGRSRGDGLAATPVRHTPMPSMRVVSTSSSRRNRGGVRAAPRLRGCRGDDVTRAQREDARGVADQVDRPKTRSDVLPDCTTSPSTSQVMLKPPSTTASSSSHQPRPEGVVASKDLPCSHCDVRFWKSRAVTSFKWRSRRWRQTRRPSRHGGPGAR